MNTIIVALLLSSVITFVKGDKLSHYFTLINDKNETVTIGEVFLNDDFIINYDGYDIYPITPWMNDNTVFLSFYKDMFTDFFNRIKKVVKNDKTKQEMYFYGYSCNYIQGKSSSEQIYSYNGNAYTEKSLSNNNDNKALWSKNANYILGRTLDNEDCIIHLRSLLRKMKDASS
ncbi:hypothetical protein Murmansk-019 [Murmansk poxvirus]|uniref:Uncharacterized protein n=1 Tax=Murmansk poxvirus TaxID=2025359 RepID=A0A223FMJ8_9POXV|nr:hypothetical protein CKM52_gp019 [Murmansk poxvirus]AST09214.1 hypothetical protein Murmansk-019 [Murmansk poxvirus]